jgi:hypothetical protein
MIFDGNRICILLCSVLSSGIQHHVVRWKPTDVSEEHVAFIFRDEEQAKQEISMKQAGMKMFVDFRLCLRR